MRPFLSWRNAFFVLASVLVILMPLLSRDYGITWDEWTNANNGLLGLRYLLSWGQDRSFLTGYMESGVMYSHLFYSLVGFFFGLSTGSPVHFVQGGLFEFKNILPFFHFSHWMNSLFGFTAMGFAGLLAKRIAGWRAAVLALLFMAFSPRFFGSSMNNPKDIPFAATYVVAVYFLSGILRSFPKISWKDAIGFSLGTGLAIGTRIGGFLPIFYLVLFCGILSLKTLWKPHVDFRELTRPWIAIGLISLAGFGIGLLFWPYGQLNPWVNPLLALGKMSKFDYWSGEILFEGKFFKEGTLPWYYIPKWILISAPLHFLAGFFIAVPALWRWPKTFAPRLWASLALMGIFPILFVIVRNSIIYDSWRHLYFIYPLLVVLAALGWEWLFRQCALKKWMAIAPGILLAGMLLEPAVWMIRNHPNEYVYFNPLVGGIRGAAGHYETDYWGNCLREASEKLLEDQRLHPEDPAAVVRSEGAIMATYPFLRAALGDRYYPFGYPIDFLRSKPYLYVKTAPPYFGKQPWKYSILFAREWDPALIRDRKWPPEKKGFRTVHTVEADGVPLCAVIYNENHPRFL
ncbi:MAG: glycosyltransferase family 39 protein [Candidatus Omnitrophota bacterium]